MEISTLLSKAWAEVQSANLPTNLQEIAFKEAVRLLSGSATPTPPGAKVIPPRGSTRTNEKNSETEVVDAVVVVESEFLEKIQVDTGVQVHDLEHLYFIDGSVPKINLTAARLGSTMADRQKNIAKLLVVGRHFGLVEDDVPASAVREECKRLRCFDGNFAANMDTLKSLGIIMSGAGKQKVFRVRPGAVDPFVKLVGVLLTPEQQ